MAAASASASVAAGIRTQKNQPNNSENPGDISPATTAVSSSVYMNGVSSGSSACSVNSKLPFHTVRGYGSAGQSFSFDSAGGS